MARGGRRWRPRWRRSAAGCMRVRVSWIQGTWWTFSVHSCYVLLHATYASCASLAALHPAGPDPQRRNRRGMHTPRNVPPRRCIRKQHTT